MKLRGKYRHTRWKSVPLPFGPPGALFPHQCVRFVYVAHPASYPMGTETLSCEGNEKGCNAEHSPPSSAEVKSEWSYPSTPPTWIHGVHKDNFFASSDNIHNGAVSYGHSSSTSSVKPAAECHVALLYFTLWEFWPRTRK
jgi:hypothetical protein